jgi:hypothetical protein
MILDKKNIWLFQFPNTERNGWHALQNPSSINKKHKQKGNHKIYIILCKKYLIKAKYLKIARDYYVKRFNNLKELHPT